MDFSLKGRVLELGCGENPHPDCQVHVDVRDIPNVTDFSCDFNAPLPIQSDDFDGILCRYCLEHLSWRNVRTFLAECHRILKPGGRVAFLTPNTMAQVQWIIDHPNGWDGKDDFDSFSCVLFGDLDYPENSHKCWLSPSVVVPLFQQAGFKDIAVTPAGERQTDMLTVAEKPEVPQVHLAQDVQAPSQPSPDFQAAVSQSMSREEMFDRVYFGGGGKVGGYAREGYWDYPVHEITAQHVLARKPSSVLEIGCARGYILKRLQDAGIAVGGFEISKHCLLTRAMDSIYRHDICLTPWPGRDNVHMDLCFSIAVLEHIPEQVLPAVIAEMRHMCDRGLHGIDFGEKDDGFDKTHCTLKPKAWWLECFAKFAPGWPVEIVDKEDLEKGQFPKSVAEGDGKIKLNFGSFITMHHYGWINVDAHDLAAFAQANGYRFVRGDLRKGLQFPTATVDLMAAQHFLEHLTYAEGVSFLRECRRVIKPEGIFRIAVPDAALLLKAFQQGGLNEFDEINDPAAASPTPLGKYWQLLHAGHQAAYDEDTLCWILKEAGWAPHKKAFRDSLSKQILTETIDMVPCLSLYMDATPAV